MLFSKVSVWERMKEEKLTIRKNGKYYQLGYYDQSKWVNVKQIGTPKQLLDKLSNTTNQNVPKD
jgi:hypothetical protein